jgi:hypothetical protein
MAWGDSDSQRPTPADSDAAPTLLSMGDAIAHAALMSKESERLGLEDALTHLLEECRMVLPGVQALFGFQLIAVFNNSFLQNFTFAEQCMHLVALALIAIAGGLIMTPAALHRQCGALHATERYLRVCSRLLVFSMVPLVLGIAIDFYLISRLVLGAEKPAAMAAIALAAVLAGFWFVYPRIYRSLYRR